MEIKEARKLLESQVVHIAPTKVDPVTEPEAPLWPGIFVREEQEDTVLWRPVSIDEWRNYSRERRVQVVIGQMAQISEARDASRIVEVAAPSELADLHFTPSIWGSSIHAALCHLYQEITKRPTTYLLATDFAVRIVRLVFDNQPPLADLSGESALAMVLLYGESYCV